MALIFIVPHDLPQNKNNENASSNTNSDPDEHLRNLHFPVKKSPALSLDDIAQKTGSKNVYLTHHKLRRNRKQTRNQQTSLLWYNVRKTRITASKAKRCLLKDSTSPSKAIQEV